MVVFSPHNFHDTLVSEVASIFAVFHSRVFARDVVASSNVSIRRLSFFIGPPLRSIMPFSHLPAINEPQPWPKAHVRLPRNLLISPLKSINRPRQVPGTSDASKTQSALIRT